MCYINSMPIVRVPVEKVRRGRPPLAEAEKMTALQFRVRGRMLNAFTKLAAELGCTKADLYRGALADYLKRAKVEWEG